jgi:hypothetical protein
VGEQVEGAVAQDGALANGAPDALQGTCGRVGVARLARRLLRWAGRQFDRRLRYFARLAEALCPEFRRFFGRQAIVDFVEVLGGEVAQRPLRRAEEGEMAARG